MSSQRMAAAAHLCPSIAAHSPAISWAMSGERGQTGEHGGKNKRQPQQPWMGAVAGDGVQGCGHRGRRESRNTHHATAVVLRLSLARLWGVEQESVASGGRRRRTWVPVRRSAPSG